ncbi:Disease resistance family protein [Rhynchospora pubera]|uniref:Disease resistance family protein n=1 Tax=Rhynchospora pubera TaxID=906938 RepID=A0AAV8FLI6_9POAL|nr:Disease resistance family protein [Rhynchospora pubera]
MAEAAVSGIIIKLGDLLFGEVVFLYDVSNQMELVKLQLHQMQCFLKDAVSKQKKDERVKGWVRDIRDVAYETEDAIDEYLWVVARSRLKHVGFFEKCFRKPFEIYARHKLGKSICKIQIRLNIISQGRTIFGIKNLDDERSDRRPMLRGPWVPDDDEYEIVGFKNNQRSIISQLIAGKRTPRRQIISIVGQGGLGKTTLAHKVYNSKEVKGYFDERIWLTVSIEFNLNVLLKKVLDKLGKPIHKETENDDEYLLVEVKLSLRQKRYLIVFDDVWTFESIDQFQKALPNDSNGSRVLMTSRFSNIAKRADLGSITHELQFLNEEESLQLLLAKAFFPSTSNISDDLIELAKKLAKKCGGLPLALVLIGGLLSMRAPNYNDWYRVLQTMDWKSNCIECMKVLGTSYEDLPHSLKPCFLYFGCFPEDTDIGASALMRMWIAEGFIQSDGRGTLEDTAECYLEELIQR